MEEIRSILADMARCVASDEDPTLDPVIRAGIRRAVDELERFIPGLDPVPDAEGARHMVSAAKNALLAGRPRVALSRSLRGLSYAPHDPELHYRRLRRVELSLPLAKPSRCSPTRCGSIPAEKARRSRHPLGFQERKWASRHSSRPDDLDRAA
jgi:hypothetical protein